MLKHNLCLLIVFSVLIFRLLFLSVPSRKAGMSSMIGLPSDRALVEDDECLRFSFIFIDYICSFSMYGNVLRMRTVLRIVELMSELHVARRWIRIYAADQDKFFDDFKNTYIKLVNCGASWKTT